MKKCIRIPTLDYNIISDLMSDYGTYDRISLYGPLNLHLMLGALPLADAPFGPINHRNVHTSRIYWIE